MLLTVPGAHQHGGGAQGIDPKISRASWRDGIVDWCASSANAHARQFESATQAAVRGVRPPTGERP
ncbi:MAG TPA: hypothetical protein VKG20_17410 [Methylomirabilota bacterium]|nr:hypothetical protein [Methylomirabilota bacterium]